MPKPKPKKFGGLFSQFMDAVIQGCYKAFLAVFCVLLIMAAIVYRLVFNAYFAVFLLGLAIGVGIC